MKLTDERFIELRESITINGLPLSLASTRDVYAEWEGGMYIDSAVGLTEKEEERLYAVERELSNRQEIFKGEHVPTNEERRILTMANEHLQKVVELENKELNEINERKAKARLQEIRQLQSQVNTLNDRIAKIRQELVDMQWDEVSINDVLGTSAQ